MDKIEIELNLNSITDTLKSLADGIKEHRSTKLIDVEGKGISVTIACNREDHFLKDLNKNNFINTGLFSMTLNGPKTKQVTIDEYVDSDDNFEETQFAAIFEVENEPKRAYYNRNGEKHKTSAFKEFLDQKTQPKTKGGLMDELNEMLEE